jgi:molybdate transport system substrate-binding protein
VFAAASLTSPFTALGKAFEAAHPGTTVRFSFGSSSGLAQQIIAGAPADVFASASAKNMAQVSKAGDATGVQAFAKNAAEIAVAPGKAKEVTTLADLAKPGLTVALCDPAVPCGALAHKVLAKAHVTVTPKTLGLDVKSTLAYVTGGQVDAAIVYVTDVLAVGRKVRGVPIPADVNATTAYEIGIVKAGPLAEAFERFVLSSAGMAVLSRAGFEKP